LQDGRHGRSLSGKGGAESPRAGSGAAMGEPRREPVRVWAPRARRVELEAGGSRHPMQPRPDGWFESEPGLAPEVDYAFRLDGGEPLPDPRSPRQPRGAFGPSRRVDHAAFPWSDRGWQPPPLGSAVLYELHVGTFTPEGTFDAAIARLDPLVDLGVTHVELMPVATFPGHRGWGYDGVLLYAPQESYGGPEGLKRLVDACHRRGLAVLLDVVYNHLGPAGNHLPRFGPYFTDRHHTPWGDAVNLDGPESDEVRRFFVDNALQWLRDYHLDGLRLDAVHALLDTSALPFLEELAAEVAVLERHLGRRLALVAESDANDPWLVRSRDAGGCGLDAHWSDDFHHALHALLTGERGGYYEDFGGMAPLARTLEQVYAYAGDYSPHRRRRQGRPATGLPADRFVVCLQNHDQVGNRAAGERTSHLLSPERLRVGAALLLTSPYIPLLFMGEEWAASTPFQYFTDHADPELARAVREGRRREFAAFGWRPEDVPDPQDEATFTRSTLDWKERERSPHREILDWHRRLIALRRDRPDLTDPRRDRIAVTHDEAAGWLVVQRGATAVVAHLGEERQRIPVAATEGGDPPTLLLASDPAARTVAGGVELSPDCVAILETRQDVGR